jgi:ABC-type molybdate transport system substrate-binding protein
MMAEYPIARITTAANPQLGSEWIALVLSSQGQAVLQRAGFLSTQLGGD